MGWFEECASAAKEVTQAQKQMFIDAIWAGKTLGEAREVAGISFDAANGVMRENIEQHNFSSLRRVAV